MRAPDPPRVLYLVPTLHNPTGATMSEARRARIVALARAHELLIIEDDVYAMLAPAAPPAFARLAPERTLHVGSFSKSVSPGLRLGYLVPPAPLLGACAGWLQATHPAAHPLGGWLVHRALETGLVDDVAAAIRAETARRSAAVRAVLGEMALPADATCLHVWLPMETARAEAIMRRAARHDIVLAAPQAFLADAEAGHAGLRLCLGNADAAQLTAAVGVLAGLMREDTVASLDERALI
jgi:DNA-binding transcriptional MocR family regulator